MGRCLRLLYSDEGMVVLRYPKWLQGALNVIIGLFRGYVLVVNIAKSKVMTFQMGEIWPGMSEEAVGRRCTVRGYTYRDRLRQRIPCQYCGV